MKAAPCRVAFWVVVLGYCLLYAPYGINETDGGFLSGLAWQLLQGKQLYTEIVYVRPPLPVWLRALELQLLPEQFAILGERWIWYFKTAVYSLLAARLLAGKAQAWWWALPGFIVSAHNYPACAWHTTDGIFFAVLSFYALFSGKKEQYLTLRLILSALLLLGSALSKQSFFPLIPVWAALLWMQFGFGAFWRGTLAFSFFSALFFLYLQQQGSLQAYWALSSGAAGAKQAIRHGLLDYFDIPLPLVLGSGTLIALASWFRHRAYFWILAIFLMASYVWQVYQRQDFTVPFGQSRILFWMGAAWSVYAFYKQKDLKPLALMAVCWAAAVSWGYNLPILLATPWVYGFGQWAMQLRAPYPAFLRWVRPGSNLLLLLLFFYAAQFVYRDGRRSEMIFAGGDIFPALTGIRMDAESVDKYRELRQLVQAHPNFATLPAFPQAHLLTQTQAPLPLDWVVQREMNSATPQVREAFYRQKPVLLLEKKYLEAIKIHKEYALLREILEGAAPLGEHQFFVLYQIR
jgi:hypothetical protein